LKLQTRRLTFGLMSEKNLIKCEPENHIVSTRFLAKAKCMARMA